MFPLWGSPTTLFKTTMNTKSPEGRHKANSKHESSRILADDL
jgi:hypothetical protein